MEISTKKGLLTRAYRFLPTIIGFYMNSSLVRKPNINPIFSKILYLGREALNYLLNNKSMIMNRNKWSVTEPLLNVYAVKKSLFRWFH